MLNNLLPNSFLNSQVKDVATTVFPSTTSVVLTSLATGKYPTTHSVNGWFSYVAETNESIIPLPFINRFEPNEKLRMAKANNSRRCLIKNMESMQNYYLKKN